MGILMHLVMAGEKQRMVQTLLDSKGAKCQPLEYHWDNTKNNRPRDRAKRKRNREGGASLLLDAGSG